MKLARPLKRTGFTLNELMVVVGIIALLMMLLVPSIQWAVEEGRLTQCNSLIKNMGAALSKYVADNNGLMPPFCYTDRASYDYLMTRPVTDQYGNVWYATYQAGYIYRNLIGIYLGLGDCMPGHADNYGTQYPRWEGAMYSHFKPFICPSGTKMTSPYGYAVDPSTGRGEGQCYYAQNVSWDSQSARIFGGEWPQRSAYFPLFTDTSQAILLYEQWSGNGGAGGGADTLGQPYSTHYRMGINGPEGIARNTLYADWHCAPIRCGGPDQQTAVVNGTTYIYRGNETGFLFQDQWFNKTWTCWDLKQSLKQKG